MQTYLDCIPCFVRQALEAARMATSDEKIHEAVLRRVLNMAGRMPMDQSPPVMGRRIHRLIRELCGDADPYRAVKERFNRAALALYPQCRARVEEADDPLETAVRLAIAGNVIDFGALSDLDEKAISASISQALEAKLFGDLGRFREALHRAGRILYLGDNCGEIVFDRLLIEQLLPREVTFVVRGRPVINDVTMTDAETSGMTRLVPVIDNGSDIPGTVLAECAPEFGDLFRQADLVIAKGQGNYETLSDEDHPIVFLFKAKCPVIARHVGCETGRLVVQGPS